MREVKEETGLEVRAAGIIREAYPPKDANANDLHVGGAGAGHCTVFVGDAEELAEVRWVTLAEAVDLLPGLFEPVREHLARRSAACGSA